MNKAILPLILAGIIVIAGVFAFAPIENVITTHGLIQGNQLNQILIASSDELLTTPILARCNNNDFIVYYVVRGGDGDTFSINLNANMVLDQSGTFEATGVDGAGINMIAGVGNGDAGTTTSFTGGQDSVDGIFTLVGQSDDNSCSLILQE